MLARYESPLQTMRYNARINQTAGPRDNSDQQILYQIKMNDYKMTSRSNSIKYQNSNHDEDSSGRNGGQFNSDKKGDQGQQINGHQINQLLKKGSSLERLTELISSKQGQSSGRAPSSNTFHNTANFDSNNPNMNKNEINTTDRQRSLKKIQKDLSSLFNKTQINNSATKQKFLVVSKLRTEADNTSAEEVKYQRLHSENKQSNPNPLKTKYNALLDVIGKDRVQQIQHHQNPAYKLDYETIRNYKPEKSDLRKQVEGMVDKIQRKLKEEEDKMQQMQQQANQKIGNNNFGNRYQQFLMTKVNKDNRMNQTMTGGNNNSGNNNNNSSNGLNQTMKKDDIKQRENYQQQTNQNGNVTAYGITLQQKENMINKKTEQFFYNAYNQILQTAKQESSPNMETSAGMNNSTNGNNKTILNFSAVQSNNHEKNSKGEETPNIFRVRKIKQNNLVDAPNRVSGGGTLEDLGDSAFQQEDFEHDQEKFDENKFLRNHDELLKVGKDKRYSPKRIMMPQNQATKTNTTNGSNNNLKTFYGSDSGALFNQTTNNFGNGIYLNLNNHQNVNLNSSSQPVLMGTGGNKQFQSTVNQMDQLERIVFKLRGQQQQQDVIRSSSNPNTRMQIQRNKDMNRVNSEKSFRQKEIHPNTQTITERDESRNSNINNITPPQNVIFRPFTTQNMNFTKLKNIKTPTLPSSKDQSTTIDGLFGSSSSFKGPLNNLDRFEIGQIIGQGSYAVVRKAKDVLTDRIVAIKIYDKFRLIDPQKRNNVKREMHILQKLEHKNIIQLLMTVDTRTTVNLVMEYVSSLSLRHFLKSKPNHRLIESEAKSIFRQILGAVNYCHSNDVIHRDLKLENILISEETCEIKLIDFGFSIKAPNDKKLNMFCGTASYMSPELVQQQDYYGKPTDVWALGVLLFVLLQGRFPFKELQVIIKPIELIKLLKHLDLAMFQLLPQIYKNHLDYFIWSVTQIKSSKDDNELFKKICKNDYKFSSDLSMGAQNLIKSIMKINPLERPSTKTIQKDPWLNQP